MHWVLVKSVKDEMVHSGTTKSTIHRIFDSFTVVECKEKVTSKIMHVLVFEYQRRNTNIILS